MSAPWPAIPERLRWVGREPAGRAWLDALPGRVAACAERWTLRVGDPFPGSHVSLALPATRADGTEAVLKLQLPHRECEHEAEALRVWDGDGAVRLLEHEPAHHALLVERCLPGTPLSEVAPEDALGVLIGLLPRLWRTVAGPFHSLASESARWTENLPRSWERAGRPFERALVDAAIETLGTLATSQPEQVLLHQDLHADNVLRAGREPWLVIDPKPLCGERAFSAAPIVRSAEMGHGEAEVRDRLDRLVRELELDPERTRGWAFAQTLAWVFDGDRVIPRHLEIARWLRPAR